MQARVPQLVEHLFRHESGKIISVLTRILGLHNLDLAEEIVQETLLKALQVWPYHPPLDNPSAWLMRVARNKAIDLIRKEKHRRRYADSYENLLKSEWTLRATVDESMDEPGIEDDMMAMVFSCCHPALTRESQIALILRTLFGLTAREIAEAFLTKKDTIQKRLYRAKLILKETTIPFEVPTDSGFMTRRDVVLAVLYLLFNEGYHASHGADAIRLELCRDALRLTLLLAGCDRTKGTEVYALVALMCFQAGRLPARTNENGDLHLLQDQDRSVWDRQLIGQGFRYLSLAGEGVRVSKYHLEAGIAAQHCLAPNFEATDWLAILELYDLLLQLQDSPIIRLNRAIVLGHVHGPDAAIPPLRALDDAGELEHYHLLPATLGEFYRRSGQTEQADLYFRKALDLVASEPDRQLLRVKLRDRDFNSG